MLAALEVPTRTTRNAEEMFNGDDMAGDASWGGIEENVALESTGGGGRGGGRGGRRGRPQGPGQGNPIPSGDTAALASTHATPSPPSPPPSPQPHHLHPRRRHHLPPPSQHAAPSSTLTAPAHTTAIAVPAAGDNDRPGSNFFDRIAR